MTPSAPPNTPPTVVLTRPEAQSHALAARLEASFGAQFRVIVAPIIEIRDAGPVPDLTPYRGVILTSVHAVHRVPRLTGVQVFCVGKRTADVARAAGAEVVTVAPDAATLLPRITGPGPLLHLRGEHAAVAVAQRLTEAGTEAAEAIVYRQVACPLSSDARRAIEGADPVVVPLFSPRSARLVGDNVQPGLAVHAIAMSPAVAQAWRETTGGEAETCTEPTGEEMWQRIVMALRRMLP